MSAPATDGRRAAKFDLVVDVRTKLEFWLGHLPGAECVPVQKVGQVLGARADLPRSTRILVYCASGSRSAVAVEQLRRIGFNRVTDGGGMAAAARRLEN